MSASAQSGLFMGNCAWSPQALEFNTSVTLVVARDAKFDRASIGVRRARRPQPGREGRGPLASSDRRDDRARVSATADRGQRPVHADAAQCPRRPTTATRFEFYNQFARTWLTWMPTSSL